MPTWITPTGFLGTITQLEPISFQLNTVETDSSFEIINGKLPAGLVILKNGLIKGRPFAVGETVTSKFTVRASNNSGITDRSFSIDTVGHVGPAWLTPSGPLAAGLFGTYHVLNKEYVDYQLSAEELKLPDGQQLRYYIADNDGRLPPGLILSESGRITGQVNDVLRIDFLASILGGYDDEAYDRYPYDHSGIENGVVGTTSKYISKTYQFYVTVTDSILTDRQAFSMTISDPNSLRVDNTNIDSDTSIYTADEDYLLAPQWLTPTNLGVVRANNNFSLQLSTYDFNPFLGPTTYDWTTPTVNQDGSPSIHPPNFKLDTATGVLYAVIPYQPVFSITYNFTVSVTKTDLQTGDTSTANKTFTLTIKGSVDNAIEFTSPTILGTLSPGYISELKIDARYTELDSPVLFSLVSGHLPGGLTLATDGTIQGRVDYDCATTFDVAKYGFNDFKLDGGLTTLDRFYHFTVQAGDIYNQGSAQQTFSIGIDVNTTTKYTQVYSLPLLPLEQRYAYRDFVNDTYTFDRSVMYRPNDPNFGIQQKIKMYLEFGLEQTDIDAYFTEAMVEFFNKKRFAFGDIAYSKATDSSGNYVYDIVYVQIIDTASNNNGKGVNGSVTISGVTVYPNNLFNMQSRLEGVIVNGRQITTDEFLFPRFMRTIQTTGNQLGYVPVVPICYALPGNGATIVEKIAQSGFQFNTIDFTIDRFVIDNNLTSPGAKYLMFPTKDDNGNNLGQALSYLNTTTNIGDQLITEDGLILYLE